MPGLLEQIGALITAGNRNMQKNTEAEWLLANPGKSVPAGPVIGARKEGVMQNAIRRGSEVLADTFTTPGTLPNRQFEEGFQSILSLLSPVDETTGLPNADKAGLVLSAKNIPKIRKAMARYLSENPQLAELPPAAQQAAAYANAKYPKLSTITNMEVRPTTKDYNLRGEYDPLSNRATTFVGPSRTDVGDIANTYMHESLHGRQAIRRSPQVPERGEKGYWDAVDALEERGKSFLEKYRKYQADGNLAFKKSSREARDREYRAGNYDYTGFDAREEGLKAAFNHYRWSNPFEIAAHQAGDTARESYRQFAEMNRLAGYGDITPQRTLAGSIAGAIEKTKATFDDIINLLGGK